MKRICWIILCIILTGCCKPESETKIIYKIPPEKQEIASKMIIELIGKTDGASDFYWKSKYATEIVEKIYGEPVEIRGK